MTAGKASRIPAALRTRLAKVTGASAIVIAGVMASYFEGRVHTVYLDPVGIPTVCDGVTGPDVVPGKTYTDAECDALLHKHLRVAEQGARSVLVHYPTYNKWRQASLIDFTYNAGQAKLASSTMARRFNAGDAVGGCTELVKWVKARQKGILVTLKGLVTRREAEMALCLEGFNP